MHKFGIPPSLLDAVKQVKDQQAALQQQAQPEVKPVESEEIKEGADICAVCDHDPCICETGQHIEEAEGGGTSVKDVKDQAKAQADRAKLTLQSAMLRIKQAKEREAIAKKKKSIKESFSPAQIDKLKAEYSTISTIDPSSAPYKKLVAMLDKLDTKTLETLAGAKIKFVSGLAQNRVNRAKLKKEEVEIEEAKTDYEVYHKDYSSAVQTAIKQAEKRGFEVDMDDWHDKVATGPKKPSAGKTNSFSIKLTKDGKPVKKALQMQVYNMDNHKYELNMYIEDYDINSLFSEAWKKKNEEATAADDKKSIKKGDKLTGKKEPIEIEPELKDSNNK